MRTQNKKVPEFWANNKPAKGYGSLHTDGQNLYSYNLKIGFTKDDGQKILLVRKRSVTTTKHINYVRRFANEIVNVDIFEKFVKELRSGKYVQVFYGLRDKNKNDCFCASGLLAILCYKNIFKKYSFNDFLTESFWDKYNFSESFTNYLVRLNDYNHYSFTEIANILEKEYLLA